MNHRITHIANEISVNKVDANIGLPVRWAKWKEGGGRDEDGATLNASTGIGLTDLAIAIP